jgi:SNF2 family DNA or RNA helicase
MAPEEAAFYEALRRQSIERIAEPQEHPGQLRIKILTEITRLRQAACHPRLVLKDSPLSSAKLRAFMEILNELRENNHRALVFSQFVGHLSLIREQLDSQGIHYQYLDGSTPAKQRKIAVDAFQQGEGELFLISLKAGGAGLNLTAADYVIHMDPWWNPAVEDQASDRAHRMGQTRPVTIYRMVVQNSIEEKIIQLHQQKRDLANSLLEGSDHATPISVDDLVELIHGNQAPPT